MSNNSAEQKAVLGEQEVVKIISKFKAYEKGRTLMYEQMDVFSIAKQSFNYEDEKSKRFEVVKCECGNLVPVEYAHYDEDANVSCPKCVIEASINICMTCNTECEQIFLPMYEEVSKGTFRLINYDK